MEEAKKRVLGRGIAALIPRQEADVPSRNSDKNANTNIREIAVDALSPGIHQPRTQIEQSGIEELAESIRRHGVLHPIIVQPMADDKYVIVAGERRWRASIMAGLSAIPCIVKNVSDGEGAEIALVENIQRQNLSVLDEAKAYIRLIEEFSYSYEDLAQKLGKSRSHVINTIRVTKLPLEIQKLLHERKISAGHARAILAHADPMAAAKTIVESNLNVREAEKLARSSTTTNDNQTHRTSTSHKFWMPSGSERDNLGEASDVAAIANALAQSLGMKVSIQETKDGGEMTIQFKTMQELDSLVQKLGQSD